MTESGIPVSHHPLRPLLGHGSVMQAFFGFIEMMILIALLIAILLGRATFEGSVAFQGIEMPLIIFLIIGLHLVYAHQAYVRFTRPTGPIKGFWFGLLDFVPSFVALALGIVILAGVVAHWFPGFEQWWRGVIGFIPIAPYTLTSLVAGLSVMLHGLKDIGRQFERARHGREVQIEQVANAVVPSDKFVLVLNKADFPHGAIAVPRKPNGGIDFNAAEHNMLNQLLRPGP